MRALIGISLTCGLLGAVSLALAQRPGDGPGAGLTKAADVEDLVTRMMAFDKNKDGKLTKAEITDRRLQRLFDRADANKDGTVTKEELTGLGEKEHAEGGFGPPDGGPPGFGPPGGPGGFFGPPRPGEILPPMLQQRLRLTAEQKQRLDELQKEVDAQLEKILNEEQWAQLKQMRERGPGGFGPPPPGGFGPPGGPPPGGAGPPPPPPDRPR